MSAQGVSDSVSYEVLCSTGMSGGSAMAVPAALSSVGDAFEDVSIAALADVTVSEAAGE